MDVDMTVIGAGPVGLYAAYYAGFRGMRTAIVGDPGHSGLGLILVWEIGLTDYPITIRIQRRR